MSAPGAGRYLERRQVMAFVSHALLDAATPGADARQVLALLYKRLDELPVVTLAEPPASSTGSR